jgi:hypothetical protein
MIEVHSRIVDENGVTIDDTVKTLNEDEFIELLLDCGHTVNGIRKEDLIKESLEQ